MIRALLQYGINIQTNIYTNIQSINIIDASHARISCISDPEDLQTFREIWERKKLVKGHSNWVHAYMLDLSYLKSNVKWFYLDGLVKHSSKFNTICYEIQDKNCFEILLGITTK